MRLTSVDLPTFGRPTTASTGCGPVADSSSYSSSPANPSAWANCSSADTGAFLDQSEHRLDDLVQGQRGGVHLDRVGGFDQRGRGPGGIDRIPAGQLGRGGSDRDGRIVRELTGSATGSRALIRGEEHLHRRVRCYHGADIAALDNDSAGADQ